MGLRKILGIFFPAMIIPKDKQLSKDELAFLYELAAGLEENSTILEIGCRNGASTYALAKGARKNRSELYSVVSTTSPQVSELEDTFWRLRFPNINILDLNFSPVQWNEHFPIDLLYVNSHDGTVIDYVFWEKLLAKDATIAYHDTNWPKAGSEKISRELNGLIKKVHGKIVQSVDSVTSFRLPGCLDAYYEGLGRENPFTKKTQLNSFESLSVSRAYSAGKSVRSQT